jgi:hypothetical protein
MVLLDESTNSFEGHQITLYRQAIFLCSNYDLINLTIFRIHDPSAQ